MKVVSVSAATLYDHANQPLGLSTILVMKAMIELTKCLQMCSQIMWSSSSKLSKHLNENHTHHLKVTVFIQLSYSSFIVIFARFKCSFIQGTISSSAQRCTNSQHRLWVKAIILNSLPLGL